MTVDPTDDCTFWYIGEAYDTNGGDWQTHIGSFSYPTCGTMPVKPVALSDSGFIPTALTVAQGSTVEWTNNGPSVNGVSDGTTLNLFDSGDLAMTDTFDFTYIAAGQYAVDDQLAHSMTVSVPLKIAPKSGHTRTRFVVTWSSETAPAGASFTVQYQRPHATKWRKFKVGVTGTHAKFRPDAGTGRYHFRAKMVDASGSSAFSVERKLRVR
jgi:plastocyanin